MDAGNKHVPSHCKVLSETLARVGDKWTILVIGTLGCGPKRFNEIRRSLDGISQRMLTLTLRGLERDGLVSRTVTPTTPPRVDYALTELGLTLLAPLDTLREWAVTNRPAMEAARRRYEGAEEIEEAA